MRMKIGSFMHDRQGILHGKIYGLGLGSLSVLFEPHIGKDGKTSFYSLIADPVLDAYEIGRAWEKEKNGMIYYSILLDSPLFAAPLHAVLFPDLKNGVYFNLYFDRGDAERRFSHQQEKGLVPSFELT